MANPDLPQGHSPGNGDDSNASRTSLPDRSRLEQILTKSPHWKKKAFRNIESKAAPVERDAHDQELKNVRLAVWLSAQLQDRNEDIQRLQLAVSRLENEKSQLDRAHRREVERYRAELESLQDAYDQFEQESDQLLSRLDQQNERLLNECRYLNRRSLLK